MLYDLKSTITDHTINLSELAERVIVGPQEDVLREIADINQSYSTDIRCTKKFRWEPGFYNKLNALQIKTMRLNTKPRTVKTAFNNVANSDWLYRRLKEKVNKIDNMLYLLRSNNLAFQDNTEGVTEATSAWLNNIASTSAVINEVDNGYTFEVYHAMGADDMKDYILFVISIDNITMNVGTSRNFAPVKCGKVKMYVGLDMLQVLGSAISDTEMRFDNRYMHHGYHIGGQYAPLEKNLQFPYIGSRGGSNSRSIRHTGTEGYVNENLQDGYGYGENRDGYGCLCLGDLKDKVLSPLSKGRLDEAVFWLNKWGGFYNINTTGPLNNYSTMYWGKPKALYAGEMDGVLTNRSPGDCRYELPENKEESYCDLNECLFVDRCTKYENAYEEVDEDLGAVRDQIIANYMISNGLDLSDSLSTYAELSLDARHHMNSHWDTALRYYDRMYAHILLNFNLDIDKDDLLYLMSSSCSVLDFETTWIRTSEYDNNIEGYYDWLEDCFPDRTINPVASVHIAPSEVASITEDSFEFERDQLERSLLEHYTTTGRGIPIQTREGV